MTSALERILEYKRAEVAALLPARPGLEARAEAAPPPRGFEAALRETSSSGGVAVIAEIKKASPSKGLIRESFDPAALALAYQEGGAACLSVLTDGPSFQGGNEDLNAARAACRLPCLRKDFVVHPIQVLEARSLGADAVLVIMAALTDAQAKSIIAEARRLGMDILVECHDRSEMVRAIALDASLIGINNRDLHTFQTRLETTEELAGLCPSGGLLVSESGIATRADIERLQAAGARGFLIGESLMRQTDVGSALRALLGRAAR